MQNFIRRCILSLLVIFSCSSFCFAADYSPAAVAKYNEGVKYSRDNNYDAAIAAFYSSIQIDPNFLDSYYNLGVLYEYTKQDDKAFEVFKELLSRNPEDDETKLKVANLYYKKGELDLSLSYLNAISADSKAYKESRSLYKTVNTKINSKNQKSAWNNRPASSIAQLNASKFSYSGFNGPAGIVKDKSGYLYVADYSENRVLKIDPKGKVQTLISGKTNSLLKGPIGVAVDLYSNIYIANYDANNILRITPSGKVEAVISNIQKPYLLYVDNQNYLFASVQGNGTVQRFKL